MCVSVCFRGACTVYFAHIQKACLLILTVRLCVFLCVFSITSCEGNALVLTGGEWFVLLSVCVHACAGVVDDTGRRGGYLASSMPQGEMTPGYAHAEKEGEAFLDVL